MADVLLVCDEPSAAALVHSALSGEGHSVETVENKADALACLAARVPDLLIHNLAAGEKDEELLRAVRQNPGLTGLPVLLITAKADWGPLFETYRHGLDGYLTRPAHPSELINRVRRLLMAR